MIQPNPDHDHRYEQACERIAQLGQKVLGGSALSHAEAMDLTDLPQDAIYDLFYWANRIRIKYVGRAIKFCSIVAGKVGACSEDCGYCSQSAKFKTHVSFNKLSVEEMEQAAEQSLQAGASSFGIVNSGRGPTEKELDWMQPFFEKVAREGKVRPCATLGELTPEQAKRLKDMGVLRVNHNLETSRRNFPNIISTHTYEDRVRTIRIAKEAGLSICSGGIFGMGEDWHDRVDMALALRELGAEVVPINFLNAIPGTALYGRHPDLTPMQALQIVAVYRFILPGQELKIAGGREKILRDLQSWMFFAGASSAMVGNYLTTFGRPAEQDQQMLRDLELPFTTFDEVEHEAQPAQPMQKAGAVASSSSMCGAGVSLPVVG